MTEEIMSSLEKVENAMEYISYANENIKNEYPDIADELIWLFDTLSDELLKLEKKEAKHEV